MFDEASSSIQFDEVDKNKCLEKKNFSETKNELNKRYVPLLESKSETNIKLNTFPNNFGSATYLPLKHNKDVSINTSNFKPFKDILKTAPLITKNHLSFMNKKKCVASSSRQGLRRSISTINYKEINQSLNTSDEENDNNTRVYCANRLPTSFSANEYVTINNIKQTVGLLDIKNIKNQDSTTSSLFKSVILKNSETLESDSYKTCKTTNSDFFDDSKEFMNDTADTLIQIHKKQKSNTYSRFENSSSDSSTYSLTHSINDTKKHNNKTIERSSSIITAVECNEQNDSNKKDINNINLKSDQLKRKKITISTSFT